MSKLFQVVANAADQVTRKDAFSAAGTTALITITAMLVSLILTGIAVLVVGERDWLSALVLAAAIPLLLLPVPLYIFGTRLLALGRINNELQQMAREDHLTGLYNRPHLLDMLERELALSQRHDYPVSILLLEISDFSALIDQYGRTTGEQLLRLFAGRIRDKIRESDLFGRFDGAQFLLVLPHTNYNDAMHMAQGLRALTAAICIDQHDQRQINVTTHIGAASSDNSGRNLNHLLNEADYALYQSRKDERPLQ